MSGIPWEKLEKLKMPHKLGILLGTIALLGVVFFFLLYQPMQKEIEATQGRIEELNTSITTLTKAKAELKDLEKRVNQFWTDYNFFLRFLPEQKDVVDLLGQVADIARAGLDVRVFQNVPRETAKEYYAEFSINLELSGTYKSVAGFFHSIGQLDRIVNLENIRLSGPERPDSAGEMILKVNCVAKTFRFFSQAELDAKESGG